MSEIQTKYKIYKSCQDFKKMNKIIIIIILHYSIYLFIQNDKQNTNNKRKMWRKTTEISHKKTWTCQRKGNFKRETESLLIAEQNNTIRIKLS